MCSGAALELIKQMESIEVPETYTGEFEVELSREDAEGSWFLGDKELSPSSKYIMSSRRGRHTLSVKDVRKEDQGKYTFVCGDLRTSASLKMKRTFPSTVVLKSSQKLPLLCVIVAAVCCNYGGVSQPFSAPRDPDATLDRHHCVRG